MSKINKGKNLDIDEMDFEESKGESNFGARSLWGGFQDDPKRSARLNLKKQAAFDRRPYKTRTKLVERLPPTYYKGSRVFDGKRDSLWENDTRDTIFQRDGYICNGPRGNGCLATQGPRDLEIFEATVDHIEEWSKRALLLKEYHVCYKLQHWKITLKTQAKKLYNEESNLQVLCKKCNSSKNGKRNLEKGAPMFEGLCTDPGVCGFQQIR